MANATSAAVAKKAATEDKRETGPAGLPGTRPVGVKPRLSPEERAKRGAESLANHERLLDARVQEITFKLERMGIASLAGRIGAYTDVSTEYVEACLLTVENSLEACRAALRARTASKPTAQKVDLRALAAKLAAQRNGVPATGQ